MFYYFRNGYRRIKRFIVWFPILWKDEDWDNAYLFEIMRFKISRMRQEIASNQRHLCWEKKVRAMQTAEELLKRNGFDDFYHDLGERIEKREKAGKCACPEKTFTFEPVPDRPEFSRMVDLKCAYCKNAFVRWHKHRDAKEQQDFDFLFKHLKKNVKRWWD